MIYRLLTALVLTTLAVTVHAEGDPAAGQTKAATCAACHGPDGNSTNPEWPKLAGQHASYTNKQLKDFKSGARENALMSPMALPLSDQDMLDLAAYYARQNSSGGYVEEALVEAGKRLYHGGNSATGVPACMGCHGPAGIGDPAAGFPRLAGQHSQYVASQLESFRTAVRSNDYQSMMRDIALKLTPAEVQAVSAYIVGLH